MSDRAREALLEERDLLLTQFEEEHRLRVEAEQSRDDWRRKTGELEDWLTAARSRVAHLESSNRYHAGYHAGEQAERRRAERECPACAARAAQATAVATFLSDVEKGKEILLNLLREARR